MTLPLVLATSAATACLVVALQMLGDWAFPGDSAKRIHELTARQQALYVELAHRDTLLESQRRMCLARLRRIERFLRDKDRQLVDLQIRLLEVRQDAERTAAQGAEPLEPR